jgi:hypothetical protein
MPRDGPGRLSWAGPRHDNDHIDIAHIQIMPTRAEIKSARPEYLPVRDPKEWHMHGVEGLLDRHFRLVREDTVGQLRDAVRFELQKLRMALGQESAAQDQKGARVTAYHDIFLEDFLFDNDGLRILVSFPQPTSAETEKECQDWWENSKRLRVDALVCLVVESRLVMPSPLFTPIG